MPTTSPANFNQTTPAQPSNGANVYFQHDASGNVSAYVKAGANLTVAGDGTLSVGTFTGNIVMAPGTQITTTSGRVRISNNPILDGTESGAISGAAYQINFYIQAGTSNLWVQWIDNTGTQHSKQLGP